MIFYRASSHSWDKGFPVPYTVNAYSEVYYTIKEVLRVAMNSGEFSPGKQVVVQEIFLDDSIQYRYIFYKTGHEVVRRSVWIPNRQATYGDVVLRFYIDQWEE